MSFDSSATTIKSSFSIENILSKPSNKNLAYDQFRASSDLYNVQKFSGAEDSTHSVNANIVYKKEPIITENPKCESQESEHPNAAANDEKYSSSIQRTNFMSPDSSCFEEEAADNLSDITADESSKW